METEKSFVFIIGAPRSGTTWVQRMLGDHPLVCTSGEIKLYSSYIAPWLHTWEAQVNLQKYGDFNGLPLIWKEEDFHEHLKYFITKAYEQVMKTKPEAAIILDKAPAYSEFVGIINQFHPDARFIHVIRDGRDVASSLLAASRGWGEPWAPKSVKKAALKWKSQVIAAKKAQQYGERYLEVRYEDLLTNGASVLGSIFDFIGVPVRSESHAAIYNQHHFSKMHEKKISNGLDYPEGFFRKGRAGDWQDALTPLQKYTFHKNAGDLLCSLGYADKSWWAAHRHQHLTLPFFSFFLKAGAKAARSSRTLSKNKKIQPVRS